MDLVVFLGVLVAVVAWVSRPIRHPPSSAGPVGDPASRVEAEARLAAIRDTEIDAAMGKLSPDEHRELDLRLRAEAVAALRSVDEPPA